MITKDDLTFTRRYDERLDAYILACTTVGSCQVAISRRAVSSSEFDLIEHEKERLKERMMHLIYGEIETAVVELYRRIMSTVESGDLAGIDRDINRILVMLRGERQEATAAK